MKLVSVFDYNELPDEEMRDLVCKGQGNCSFNKVWLLDGVDWEWDTEKLGNTNPLDTLARISQWAKDNGAHVEPDDKNPYVLFFISW